MRPARILSAASRALLAFAGLLALTSVTAADGADTEHPIKWRVIEPWLNPATGKGLFTHDGSVLTWDAMLHLRPDTPLGQYLEQVRQWGFNGLSLGDTDIEANPAAVESFCRYLKGMGIGVFIRRDWNEAVTETSYADDAMSDPTPRASTRLNPYNAQVRAYWEKRIARDYQLVPDLSGCRFDGAEYYYSNGAPWMGDGPEMQGKTGKECVQEAIRLLSDELGKHHGTLVWETCEDDPWGARQEFWYFRGLTGKIPANAFILIKDYYWDFHPGWPRHPLDFVITEDAQGNSPYISNIQLPGEYTGVNDFPWCRADHISDTMKTIVATGQQGIWVSEQPLLKRPWDHSLNMVNWYAVSELMKHPQTDPEALKAAWAKSEFGAAAASTVVEIVNKTTEAGPGMFEFDGLLTACHSWFPTLEYLDSHLCGPYRQTSRMKGMMGWVLPLDMYAPEIAAQIRADPQTRLVFNQVPITPQLKAEAMAQKEGAVKRMREAVDLWKSLRGKIADARYTEILAGLEGNLNDAIVFRQMMDLYMDWKLGTLTAAKIDADLKVCQGLEGRLVPQPLDPNPKAVSIVTPASLETFAEELRRELRTPWIEKYWRDHPNGVVVVEAAKASPGQKR